MAVAALAPFALGAAASARAQAACYDPARLSLSQKSLRRSLNYVELSTASARRCGLCTFYTATAEGCGTCTMLSGNAVQSSALCDAFAPKD